MASEHEKWRKFLKPLVGATIVLMGAVGGYFEYMQRQSNSVFKEEVSALKIRMNSVEKRDDAQDMLFDNFRVMLSDIRSDVSFIRGKMEASK